MVDGKKIIVTPDECKKKFFVVGISILLYSVVLCLLFIHQDQIVKILLEWLPKYKIEYLVLSFYLVVMSLTTLFASLIIQMKLEIPTKDFIRKTTMKVSSFLAYESMTIGLSFFATFSLIIFSSIFDFKIHILSPVGFDFRQVQSFNFLHVFILLVVSPFLEEYFFRGVLLRGLGRFGNRFALIAISLMYALVQLDISQMIPAMIFSASLILITLRYKSILPTIVIHSIYNMFVYGVGLIPNQYSWGIPLAILLVYLCMIYFFILKKSHHIIIKKESATTYLLKLFFSRVTIVLSLIILCVLHFLIILNI